MGFHRTVYDLSGLLVSFFIVVKSYKYLFPSSACLISMVAENINFYQLRNSLNSFSFCFFFAPFSTIRLCELAYSSEKSLSIYIFSDQAYYDVPHSINSPNKKG